MDDELLTTRHGPFAIAVFRRPTASATPDRTTIWLRLAVHSVDHGYVLLDAVDVDDADGHDPVQHVERLAEQFDVQALITHGVDEDVRLGELADTARLLLIEMPAGHDTP